MFDQLKKNALRLKDKITKSPLQAALSEATNDKNWNPSPKVLLEIADRTYNLNDFIEIMKTLWKKLTGEKKKKWRKILKILNLIDYLIKNGSPRCVSEFREELFTIKPYQDFAHIEDGQDRGAAIREVAKNIINLLNDDKKIEEERNKAAEIRERLGEIKGFGNKDDEKKAKKDAKKEDKKAKKDPKFVGISSKDVANDKYKGFGADSIKGHEIGRANSDFEYKKSQSYKPEWFAKEEKPEDYVIKQGTKYNENEKPKEAEQPEKKTVDVKPLTVPRGHSLPAPVIDLLDSDNSTPSSTEKKTESIFTWDNSTVNQRSQVQDAPSQKENYAPSSFSQKIEPNLESLKTLYTQTPVQTFNTQGLGIPFGVNDMNSMTNQFSQFNVGTQPFNTNINVNNTSQVSPTPIISTSSKTVTKPTPGICDNFEYKNYKANEKSLIDLADFSNPPPKKEETTDITSNHYVIDTHDLDTFWISENNKTHNNPFAAGNMGMNSGMRQNNSYGANPNAMNPMMNQNGYGGYNNNYNNGGYRYN